MKVCHFCGGEDSPHMLSDCRPDLVEHEIGPHCTWAVSLQLGMTTQVLSCYAYQDPYTHEWGTEHKHFYPDTDMTK